MRRIASVFKRNDNSKNKRDQPTHSVATVVDNSPAVTRSQTLQHYPSRKGRFLASISTDPLPVPPLDQNNSSASSSASATCSLQTPDDERGSQVALHTPSQMPRKSWFPWQSKVHPQVVIASIPPASPSPRLHPPSPPLHWPASAGTPEHVPRVTRRAQDSVDTEEDASDSSSSSSDSPVPPSSRSLPLDRMLAPTEYLTRLTVNKLASCMSQPPLLDVSDAPIFPRSVNHTCLLPSDSLSIRMHRSRTLARLQRHELNSADRRMFLAIGSRPASKADMVARAQPEEGVRYDLKRVLPHSRGLRRWIDRPFFEERYSVWTPETTSDTVCQSAVKGSNYGVLALEVSEALELLAGSQNASPQPAPAPLSAMRDTSFVSGARRVPSPTYKHITKTSGERRPRC
jgi:hypothetical protein